MPKHNKSDRELLEEIYDFLNGDDIKGKRGLGRRVEILEWTKKMVTMVLVTIGSISGTIGTGYFLFKITGGK